MKFLTENHLREYASVITTQVQIILKKWKAKSRLGLAKEVNVHYDLITLKLDIIMITAFGAGTQHLSQNLPADQNMQVVGGDEILSLNERCKNGLNIKKNWNKKFIAMDCSASKPK